jgi:predicted dienelactone hydrolase
MLKAWGVRMVMVAAAAVVWLSPARGQIPAQEPAADLYRWQLGPYEIRRVDETWHDAARGRDVPVRVYLPRAPEGEAAAKQNEGGTPLPVEATPGKHPVIVFSHGLGASRTSYGYFGNHMASWGYIVVAPSHAGSDTAALAEWMKSHAGVGPGAAGAGPGARDGWLKSSVQDPANLANRPRDIAFVIDQLSTNPLLKDVADLGRIGVAGHSFGAHTSMQIGGMSTDLPDAKAKSFRDPRVKAVLPMSPEGPGAMGIEASSWDHFAVPVLFLTGTRDYGQGMRSAEWRRAGFEHVSGVDAYLVTLNGAGHMTFGGARAGGGPTGSDAPLDVSPEEPKPLDPAAKREQLRDRVRERLRARQAEKPGGVPVEAHHVRMIDSLSTAFFDAYLREDPKAREWLVAFMTARHGDCTAEFKPADAKSGKQGEKK